MVKGVQLLPQIEGGVGGELERIVLENWSDYRAYGIN